MVKDDRFELVGLQSGASEHIAAPHYSYWKSVFRKFFSSKVTLVMLGIASVIVLLAIFQPMFSKYDPAIAPNINDKSLHFVRPCLEYWFGTTQNGIGFVLTF